MSSLVYEDKKKRERARQDIMKYLDRGDVDGALSYIQELRKRFRKESKIYSLDRLSGYISETVQVYGIVKQKRKALA